MITAYHLQVLFHNFIKCASKQLDGQTKLSNIKDILASWIILKWPRFLFHIFRFPHFQRGASCLPRFVTSWSASCWSDFRPRRDAFAMSAQWKILRIESSEDSWGSRKMGVQYPKSYIFLDIPWYVFQYKASILGYHLYRKPLLGDFIFRRYGSL